MNNTRKQVQQAVQQKGYCRKQTNKNQQGKHCNNTKPTQLEGKKIQHMKTADSNQKLKISVCL